MKTTLTSSGSLLKHNIPIKTDNWDISVPGYTEIDLVSHCGGNASGNFIYSLNMTDILTGWVESIPIKHKDEISTTNALKKLRRELPFKLLGIDSDNGTEFINNYLYNYCKKNKIQFTRGRPYKKDDNAHIEQKNWTHIRRILGYRRFESHQDFVKINKLYREKLHIMMNLFQPCTKLKSKKRIGSKIKRKYEIPVTPLDRLINYFNENNIPLSNAIKTLMKVRDSTDPFLLSQDIEKQTNHIKNHKIKSKEKKHAK